MTEVLTYEALKEKCDRLEQINAQTLQVKLTMAETIKERTDRVNALAVENAEMRGVIDAAVGVANNSSGIAGWHLNGEIADWDEILPELNIETPATDAALAAIQAQGVETLADKLDAEIEQIMRGAFFYDEISSREAISKMVREFATELREAK
ncbi:hypothetical protein [Serratia marcescens]|uniref:hypothetical protein n=1 Tax=Serratia marcescens TaxID=615 RepID=UPI0037008D75